MSNFDSIGFIGGGNMASAICNGILMKGIFKPHQIWVSGPRLENLYEWKKQGINVTNKNGEVICNCDCIFLCVKPHFLDEAIRGACNSLTPSKSHHGKLFISVLAGTTCHVLQKALVNFPENRIIRVMPNTPMLVGAGASVYAPSQTSLPSDCEFVEKILESTGIYEKVSEDMINAIGGLSGSGPAFVYLMIEAMSDGGVKQGLPRAMSTRFAAQTVLGAAKMVLETNKHPGQLKDEVCSPGGSTICGMHQLEKGSVRASYIQAIEAAVEKSRLMEKQKQ